MAWQTAAPDELSAAERAAAATGGPPDLSLTVDVFGESASDAQVQVKAYCEVFADALALGLSDVDYQRLTGLFAHRDITRHPPA